MSITINWITKVINIPISFLTPISAVLYELDVNAFRIALKDIEDAGTGMVYPDTHRHNSPVTLAGVTYARSLEIINGYTVTFEDGQYAVRCVGANHNLADVKNLNQVSLIIGNAAGLIVNTVNIGGGVGTVTEVANAVWGAIANNYNALGTTGAKLNSAGNAGDPWATTALDLYPAGSAGKIFSDNAANTILVRDYTDTIEAGIAALQTTLNTVNANTDTVETNIAKILTEVGNISAATSVAHSAASSFALSQGTVVTGSYLSTREFGDGEHHISSNGAGTVDFYYDFNIGANSIPSSFTFIGHVLDQHEVLLIRAYNWVSSSWETVGEVTGLKTNNKINCALYTEHQGTGINQGLVRIRMVSSVISAIEVHIDQIYVGYAILAPSAVDVAEEVRTELTPELSHILQIPTSGSGLTPTQATMLLEMYELLGLDPTKPLLVTQTSRTAGSISQQIYTDSSQTMVTRV